LEWYGKYLTALVRWLTDHDVTRLQGITTDLLRTYIVDVKATGLAPRTVHHHASAARAFCNFLADEGLVSANDNPARRLRMPKLPKEVLPALSVAEVESLLAICEQDRDRALILFLLDSGIRAAECCALNIGDLDMRTGAVTVHRGKGAKGRIVFVGARARKAVTRYLLGRDDVGATAPLWLSLISGERLTDWGLRQMLQRIGDRARVHCHPHKLRRSFAIWALRSGMDLARLAVLLGHSDLQVVRRYLALVTDDLQAAHREHGPVDTLLPTNKRNRDKGER